MIKNLKYQMESKNYYKIVEIKLIYKRIYKEYK